MRLSCYLLIALSFLQPLYADSGKLPFPGTEKDGEGVTSFSVQVTPSLLVPLSIEKTPLYLPGGNINLSGEWGFSEQPAFCVSGELCYLLVPIRDTGDSLSVLSAGVGGGMIYDITPRLSLRGRIAGGLYYGILNSGTTSDSLPCPFFDGGIGLDLLVSPSLSVGVGAGYRNNLGLLSSVNVFIGTSYYLSGRSRRIAKIESSKPTGPEYLRRARAAEPGEGLEIERLDLDPVFPVFFKYYDDHPVGKITLSNQEKEEITDIVVSLYIKQYMDAPKETNEPLVVGASESIEVDLLALFNDSVLDVTEATKAAAELVVYFKMADTWYQIARTETIRLYDRNAMTWDDDRKAASFVTAKDPVVLSLAKNVAALVRSKRNPAINGNLQAAMGLHEALFLHGVNYIVDPKTPYADYSAQADAIDYLQFPRQTLEYRAGDCDDLSILYCALLESVGIESAFVTVPGHIFIAFSADISAEEADTQFQYRNNLIVVENRVWIPLETTERGGDFLAAWQSGARQWREHVALDQARLYPVHEAWKDYEPVGLAASGTIALQIPASDVLENFEHEKVSFINREISDKVSELEERIGKQIGGSRTINRLGVLYARYGLLEEAAEQFQSAARTYPPAVVNLANVHFLRQDWQLALQRFEEAKTLLPDNANVLLGLARVHYELENYGLSKQLYGNVKTVDPLLAERFSYLELKNQDGARAADFDESGGTTIWMEE